MTVDEAYVLCTQQAQGHYENFPVGSWLVPREKRRYVHAVYAFARTADDFADETVQTLSVEQRLELLQRWEENLDACLRGNVAEPVFIAVREAILDCGLPDQLFRDLLSAFKQDVVKTRYANFEEVLDYCRRSANPVGRLVLHIFDYRNEALHELSDCICTGLQLANFWQDVGVDLKKNRIYLPQNEMHEHGVTEESLFQGEEKSSFQALLKLQVDRAWQIFQKGRLLPSQLNHGLAWEIKLTWLGGTKILRKIEKLNYQTLCQRPALSKWDFVCLLGQAVFKRW